MDNEFRQFVSSLTAASFFRLLMTVVLTTGSVLMAYGTEMGYRLVIGCNVITVTSALYLEYRNFKARRQNGKRGDKKK